MPLLYRISRIVRITRFCDFKGIPCRVEYQTIVKYCRELGDRNVQMIFEISVIKFYEK